MVVGAALVTLWALRLFRAHGRRYQWALSSKEDWRRADLREAFGPRWFWIASLPVAFIAEAGAACARALPLRSLAGFAGAGVPFLPSFEETDDVAGWNAPLGLADAGALVVALFGLALAFRADEELLVYPLGGQEKAARLHRGLELSRHPNRLGEHLWWLALAGAACCANGGFCPTALGPSLFASATRPWTFRS